MPPSGPGFPKDSGPQLSRRRPTAAGVRVMELNSKHAFDLFEVAGIISMFTSISMIAYVALFHW